MHDKLGNKGEAKKMLKHENEKSRSNHRRRHPGSRGCNCRVTPEPENVEMPVQDYMEMVRRMEDLEEALAIKTADCEMLLKVIASHNQYIYDKAMSDN